MEKTPIQTREKHPHVESVVIQQPKEKIPDEGEMKVTFKAKTKTVN